MYVTSISTMTESSDRHIYTILSKKKPNKKQIEWYIKKYGEKYDNTLYEHIENYEIKKINGKFEEFPTKDPCPNIELL